MKAEDKVCTLEQAEELVKLGVVLDTERAYVRGHLMLWSGPKSCAVDDECLPAPDGAELGELLNLNTGFYMLTFGKKACAEFKRKWCDYDYVQAEINNQTEAEARCAALIWLIKNGYIKAEDLKL